MKAGKLLTFAVFATFLSLPVFAAEDTTKAPAPTAIEKESPTAVENVWPELFLRPIGVLSSAIGTGFFVATLPFAAVANIPEPHDAFDHTYEAFIKTPFRFTFARPIGEYHVPIESE